jgi:hypothetical protein
MLNKNVAILKAAYIQLRIYMFWIIVAVAANGVSMFVQYLTIGKQTENYAVSIGNFLSLILIFAAIILPIKFFRRMMNLGATRVEYYTGVVVVYVVGAAFFSVLNIICLKLLDQGLLQDYVNFFNLFEIFHWDQFGIAGMFLYQFSVYLLLVSLINLMYSGLRSYMGLTLWVILAAAIPISTSIASYRHNLADGLQTLLFNDSLLAGFGICFTLSCVCLMGGWLLTSRRTF